MGNVLFFTPEDFSLADLVSSTCKENFVHPFCKLKWLVVHYIDPDPFKLRLGMESSFWSSKIVPLFIERWENKRGKRKEKKGRERKKGKKSKSPVWIPWCSEALSSSSLSGVVNDVVGRALPAVVLSMPFMLYDCLFQLGQELLLGRVCLVSHIVCMMYQPYYFFVHVVDAEGPLCWHTTCICSAAFTRVVQYTIYSKAFTSLLQFFFVSHRLAASLFLNWSERERENSQCFSSIWCCHRIWAREECHFIPTATVIKNWELLLL